MRQSTPYRSFIKANGIAVSLLPTICWPVFAQAQTAPSSSLVNVCTGLTLPRSAITGTMEPVIRGLAGPLQSTVNSLITNLLTPKLSINVTELLASAASGNPISLQAMTTDGGLLAPSDACHLRSNSYSLATTGGISIGGNTISGLGGTAPALSGEIDSIAFGNGAITADTAQGAVAVGTSAKVENRAIGGVALGQGANVLAQGGVALGAGATVTRGPLFGYAAAVLGGTYDSAGSVSVGRSGAERQLVNVAPGSFATDAVNVAQLEAVAIDLEALAALAVKHDDLLGTSLTLRGAAGTRIANLAVGSLNVDSRDAVNGSQLYQTNSLVASNTAAIDSLSGRATDLNLRIADHASNLANQGVAISANETNIAALGSAIANGVVGPVRYADRLTPTLPNGGIASQSLTLVGADAGPVGLHNVANGTLAAGSTDAVNGDQLFKMNNAVSDNTAALGTLRGDVNGQIALLDGTIALVSSQGTMLTQHGATISRLDEELALRDTKVAAQDDVLREHATRLSVLAGGLATNQTAADLAINNLRNELEQGQLGPLRYANASLPAVPNNGVVTQSLTLVGADPRPVGLHNVANGSITAGSTDAITGDQLFATNEALIATTAVLGTLRSDLAGQTTVLNTAVATLVDQGGTLTLLSQDVDQIDAQLMSHTTSLAVQDDRLRDHGRRLSTIANDVAMARADMAAAGEALGTLRFEVAQGLLGPLRYSDVTNPLVPNAGNITNNVVLVGVSSGPVALRNIAPGVIGDNSLDAVNGTQLFGLGSQLAAALGVGAFDLSDGSAQVFSFRGSSYASVQNVFDAIGSTITNSVSGAVTATKYFNTSSTMADSRASGRDSIATGPNALASGDASVASGRNAKAQSFGSVAIGNEAVATGGKSVSIGTANIASGDGAVAIGDPNSATGPGAVALGRDNIASGEGAVALGDTNLIEGDGAAALGLRNVGKGLGTVALGKLNTASGDGSIAGGTSNLVDGVGSIAFGSNNVVFGHHSLAIGSDIQSLDADSLAIGSSAFVRGLHSAAIGNRAKADHERALAVGNDAVAGAASSSAFGSTARASGLEATAIGARSTAIGAYSTAVGRDASVDGFGGSSFGQLASSQGYAATALGSGSMAVHDGSVALGTSSRTVRGEVGAYAAFGLSSAQSSVGEIAIARNLAYFDPITNIQTPVGNRQITGLAAGSADTDAVSVAQLRGVAASIGTALADSLGGGATYHATAGSISRPTYLVNGAAYGNVSDAFGALASQISTAHGSASEPATGQPSTGQTDSHLIAQVEALSAQLTSLQAQLATLQATAAGAGGNGANQVARLSNVADGRVAQGSTDAVNGSQLAAVQRQLGLAVQYDAKSEGASESRISLVVGDSGRGTVITNVAQGAVTANSRDAVNGSQLNDLNQAIEVASASADEALALGRNSVQYDGPSREAVTFASGGAPVRLRNLAAGVDSTDAATVGQLNTSIGQILSETSAYTDRQIAALGFDLAETSRRAASGTSSAMALASMPQPLEAGRSMLSLGIGAHGGERAFSLGFSGTGEDGRMVGKAGLVLDSMGQVSANAGMGWQF